MDRPKLLVIIVDRDIVDKVSETASSLGASFLHICYGKGTAQNDLLNMLGLGETAKGVIFTTVSGSSLEKIYSELDRLYEFSKPGNGICFTIPLSSVGGPASLKVIKGEEE